MRTRPTILFYSPDGCPVPTLVRQWAAANTFPLLVFSRPDEVESIVLRGHPCMLFVDGNGARHEGVGLVRRLKSDAFTAIVPVTALAGDHHPEQVQAWFAAGADEVISSLFSPAEQRSRLDAMLVRTERDVSVHPSTRLPGTTEIEREIRRRLESDQEFAVCYADLDHFKEFNDRYSYYDGDRVIYLLSRILHDVVKGLLGARGLRGTHRRRRLHLHRAVHRDQPGLQRDPRRVRYARFRCSTTSRTAGRATSSARTAGASCTGCR